MLLVDSVAKRILMLSKVLQEERRGLSSLSLNASEDALHEVITDPESMEGNSGECATAMRHCVDNERPDLLNHRAQFINEKIAQTPSERDIGFPRTKEKARNEREE